MNRISRHLSTKLGLGILLMAAPVFVITLGMFFLQSRSSSAVHQSVMLPSLSKSLPWSSKPWVISWLITTPMPP